MYKIKISQRVFIFIFASLVALPLFASTNAPQNDPTALLKWAADHMVAGLKANQATLKTKPNIVYNLANQYVVPYADLAEMSKHVLPPQIWNRASAQQREQFQKQFTMTLVRTYASALTSYKDQTVQFYPVRGGYQHVKTVVVNSEIDSTQSEPIHVAYRLVRVGQVWRLYDLSVEGVSMLESFRSQFADILSQGSMEDLLKRMSHHNKQS